METGETVGWGSTAKSLNLRNKLTSNHKDFAVLPNPTVSPFSMQPRPDTFHPALIIVDVQEDFCPPNGSLAVAEGRDIVPCINELLKLPFTVKVATKDHHPADHISFASNHPPPNNHPFTSVITIVNPNNPAETYSSNLWPAHCVVGTPGNGLLPELDLDQVDVVIEKGQDPRVEMYSAFASPLVNPPLPSAVSGLANLLKEKDVSHVYVVGLAGDFCVKASALDARKAGWQTLVIQDGVRSVDPGKGWNDAKEVLKNAGVNVLGMESDEVAWVRNP